MNEWNGIGRLTKDPDLNFTQGKGTAVCKFTMAVDRDRKNAEGQREADFIPVTVWGKSAENCANFLGKGSLVGVTGAVTTGSYNDKEGNKRYTTEIMASRVQFLDSRKKGQAQGTTSDFDNMEYTEGDTPF